MSRRAKVSISIGVSGGCGYDLREVREGNIETVKGKQKKIEGK